MRDHGCDQLGSTCWTYSFTAAPLARSAGLEAFASWGPSTALPAAPATAPSAAAADAAMPAPAGSPAWPPPVGAGAESCSKARRPAGRRWGSVWTPACGLDGAAACRPGAAGPPLPSSPAALLPSACAWSNRAQSSTACGFIRGRRGAGLEFDGRSRKRLKSRTAQQRKDGGRHPSSGVCVKSKAAAGLRRLAFPRPRQHRSALQSQVETTCSEKKSSQVRRGKRAASHRRKKRRSTRPVDAWAPPPHSSVCLVPPRSQSGAASLQGDAKVLAQQAQQVRLALDPPLLLGLLRALPPHPAGGGPGSCAGCGRSREGRECNGTSAWLWRSCNPC